MLAFNDSYWFIENSHTARVAQETIKEPEYKKIFIREKKQSWQILLSCLFDGIINGDRQKILTIFNRVNRVSQTLYRKSPNKSYIVNENEFRIKAIASRARTCS